MPETQTCNNCIWYKSELEHNKPLHESYPELSYCSILDKYTEKNHSCDYFKRELFEATESSISTPELALDHELSLSLEKDGLQNNG